MTRSISLDIFNFKDEGTYLRVLGREALIHSSLGFVGGCRAGNGPVTWRQASALPWYRPWANNIPRVITVF